METLKTVLLVVFCIDCVLLVLAVLIQSGRGGGLAGALGGISSADSALGVRAASQIEKITALLGIIFLGLALSLAFMPEGGGAPDVEQTERTGLTSADGATSEPGGSEDGETTAPSDEPESQPAMTGGDDESSEPVDDDPADSKEQHVPYSMTGFGQASFADDEMSADVTVRSVNGKHLKTKVRVGLGMLIIEERIAALVADKLRRGTVDVAVRLDCAGAGSAAFNERLISAYTRKLEKLRKSLGIGAEISLDRVAQLPGAMEFEGVSGRAANRIWKKLKPVVEEAIDRALKMRASEGRLLAAELRRACKACTDLIRRIVERGPGAIQEFRRRLTKRLNSLLEQSSAPVEPAALAREVVLYGDRSDISEEICRMKAHIKHFRQALKGDHGGRKLEFIAQEMHREANTMASKASDPVMTEDIIDLRGEVDKIREQVLNLE